MHKYLLHVSNEIRRWLINLEDGETSPDVIFIHLQLGHFSSHVGYEVHCLCRGDGITERTIAAKVIQQIRDGLLELFSREEQARFELVLKYLFEEYVHTEKCIHTVYDVSTAIN